MIQTIKDFLALILVIAAGFVFLFLITGFIFVTKWTQGVITIFDHLGLLEVFRTFPVDNPNWIMWAIAALMTLTVLKFSVMFIEHRQDSIVNIVACVFMFMIVVLPACYQLYL